MGRTPDLVLLTAAFPYGSKSETFLEVEIEVLATRFERIFVLPSHRQDGVRTLPANAELVEMDWLAEPASAAKYRSLASPQALAVIASTAGADPVMRRHLLGKLYLDNLARNVLKFRSLQRFVVERGVERAVFYDYWLENSTLALALLRRSGAITVAVSRAHGFDVYEERWDGAPIPFQQYKVANLDAVFAISAAGARHLETHLPAAPGKVAVHRLGVRTPARLPDARGRAKPLIVSCSSLNPTKRVHSIPGVLARLGQPVRWVHFGDGPDRARVEAEASKLGAGMEYEIAGHVANADVLRFYENNYVDVFLSLSAFEGLPVSMMEAQGFGIPIVACSIEGVPEIVTPTTGVRLGRDATADEAAAAVASTLEQSAFDRDSIRAFFAANFDAKINFNRFADALIALWKDQAAAD